MLVLDTSMEWRCAWGSWLLFAFLIHVWHCWTRRLRFANRHNIINYCSFYFSKIQIHLPFKKKGKKKTSYNGKVPKSFLGLLEGNGPIVRFAFLTG